MKLDAFKTQAAKAVSDALKDETTTDKALDAAADAVKKVAGSFADQVDAVRDAVDSTLGSN